MCFYIAKKMLYLGITIFLLITTTFILMKSIPGDPFTQEQGLPHEVLASLKAHYGLDRPLFEQYITYLKNILTGDFGLSIKYPGRSVNAIIYDGLPISAFLGSMAFLLSLSLGLSLGILSAISHRKAQDRLMLFLATLGISLPGFIVATLLQYFLALQLGWLPVASWGGLTYAILPILSLALMPTAIIMRLVRTSMIEVMQKEYIKMAFAKGLSSFQVIVNHAIKNSLLPVIPYLGSLAANLLVGSFVIEKIFSIPGLGQWTVTSILERDYTVILGITTFYGLLLLILMFIVDIVYGYLDPRITLRDLRG